MTGGGSMMMVGDRNQNTRRTLRQVPICGDGTKSSSGRCMSMGTRRRGSNHHWNRIHVGMMKSEREHLLRTCMERSRATTMRRMMVLAEVQGKTAQRNTFLQYFRLAGSRW
jgi:hypothetical protein